MVRAYIPEDVRAGLKDAGYSVLPEENSIRKGFFNTSLVIKDNETIELSSGIYVTYDDAAEILGFVPAPRASSQGILPSRTQLERGNTVHLEDKHSSDILRMLLDAGYHIEPVPGNHPRVYQYGPALARHLRDGVPFILEDNCKGVMLQVNRTYGNKLHYYEKCK